MPFGIRFILVDTFVLCLILFFLDMLFASAFGNRLGGIPCALSEKNGIKS